MEPPDLETVREALLQAITDCMDLDILDLMLQMLCLQ
mgnify:CR=1 FL=1